MCDIFFICKVTLPPDDQALLFTWSLKPKPETDGDDQMNFGRSVHPEYNTIILLRTARDMNKIYYLVS